MQFQSATNDQPAPRIIPLQEIEKASLLRLTILESKSYNSETIFEINACGYPKSKRKANDGRVYVGTKDLNVETQEAVNDILFSLGEIGMGNRHFVIEYSIESKNYYIRDSGEGTGTFIQIDKSITLQNEYVISYGSYHMFVAITNENQLILKFIDGPNENESQ